MTETYTVKAFSTKTKGIKTSEEWINFSSEDSKYSSDTMGDFMENNLEKGIEIELDVIEKNGDKRFTEINLNPEDSEEEKDFKKGSKVKSGKEKNINRAVALKASVELNKEKFPDQVATEEVISIAQRFESYLKGDK